MSGFPPIGGWSGAGQEDDFDLSLTLGGDIDAELDSHISQDLLPLVPLPPPATHPSLSASDAPPHGGSHVPPHTATSFFIPSAPPPQLASLPYGSPSSSPAGIGLAAAGFSATPPGFIPVWAVGGTPRELPFEEAARTSPVPSTRTLLAAAVAWGMPQPHASLGGSAAEGLALLLPAAAPVAGQLGAAGQLVASMPLPLAAAEGQLAAAGSGSSDGPVAAAQVAPPGALAAEPAAAPTLSAAAAAADASMDAAASTDGSSSVAGTAAAAALGAPGGGVAPEGAAFAAAVQAAAAGIDWASRAPTARKPYSLLENPKRVEVMTERGFPLPPRTVERDGYSGVPAYCPGCGVDVLSQAAINFSHQKGNKSSNLDGEWKGLHRECAGPLLVQPGCASVHAG